MSQITPDVFDLDGRRLLLPLARQTQPSTARKPSSSSQNIRVPPDYEPKQHELALRKLFGCAACVSFPGTHSNCDFHDQCLADLHALMHVDTPSVPNGPEDEKGKRQKFRTVLLKTSELHF
jgi:hypothetical protein